MKCCNRNTPRVLEVGCCDAPTLFHKVIIPASIGDETTMPPRNGAYRNALVVYDASGEVYFYSSDGIPTHISGDLDKLKELIEKAVAEEAAARDAADKKLAKDIEDEALTRAEAITELANQLLGETNARIDGDRILDDKIEAETRARSLADNEIWTEINTIEIASDVVDIVGTYAALQAYDTSKLQDNDIIKVLKDETHSNATTYYRWNKTTSQFSYVGEEGPYYTTSQTDTLLAGKQDTLTAGSNIQISNNVISATDTTYTAGTNVSISSQNVISATDTTYTAGTGISITDGVISSTAKSGVVLYFRDESNLYKFYRDSGYTDLVTYAEMVQMLEDGNVQVVDNPVGTQEMIYTVVAHTTTAQGQAEVLDFVVYGGDHYCTFDWYNTDAGAQRYMTYTQKRLTAGSNISITNGGTVISATDTTYSNFVGTDGTAAGTAGLVPAPATTDAGKFLKADGTWDTAGGATNNINSSDWNALWQ